ncbi:protein Wnt-1-like [Limulus polyphemus]|uniref:Protein Wnt n=1 Tax=Limulus polyphemus TaxID=6850 RepID=A0ABM1BJE9_LIMPO|nr:protein Wnt-1-like [Limulus polyphemus]
MKELTMYKKKITHLLPRICPILLFLARVINATWWLLGMTTTYEKVLQLNSTTYQNFCKNLHYLVEKQQDLCGLNHNVLITVGQGAKMGIKECQYQFRTNRWNCSTFNGIPNVFGEVLNVNSREKAFVFSISAAGVAYSITKACSTGALVDCGCDPHIRARDTKGRWEWGGCSDDIKHGSIFAKDFVDSGEDRDSPDGLMNIHNNRAGRKALRKNLEVLCKCHGVSGSCSVKVCWRRLKPFRFVGDWLSKRYDGATHVKTVQKRRKLRLRPFKNYIKQPSKKDLVYFDESPDYCNRNDALGMLGTVGRLCNQSSYGVDGCRLMCCGRGYQTVLRHVEEKCKCKFKWCCKVLCEKCRYIREDHYCN